MKTRYIIASLFSLSLVFQACQKDEFEDIMLEERDDAIEAKQMETPSSKQTINLNDDNNLLDQVEDSDHDILTDHGIKVPTAFVKEVSDGDEESDDDESTN